MCQFVPGNVSASTSQPKPRTQHSMRFPATLAKKGRSGAAETKLVCIYLKTPCLFQVRHSEDLPARVGWGSGEETLVCMYAAPFFRRAVQTNAPDCTHGALPQHRDADEAGQLLNSTQQPCMTVSSFMAQKSRGMPYPTGSAGEFREGKGPRYFGIVPEEHPSSGN